MPFKSKAQQRFMFAAEERGDVPKGTAEEWAHKTPNIKKLPEHVKKHKKTAEEIASEILKKAGFAPAALSVMHMAKKRKQKRLPKDIANDVVEKTASQNPVAAAAIATSKSLRDFFDGAKWAPGGIEYQGTFKLASPTLLKNKKTAAEIAVQVLQKVV